MKILADGTEVWSRGYYYLLDWNEYDDWRFITDNFNKEKLRELTIEEYKLLFNHAFKKDLEKL